MRTLKKNRAYREICTECGESCDLDRGEYYCDVCAYNAPLNDAARDYIRGGESKSDAGDIFEPLQTDSLSDCLQDIARGLGDDLVLFNTD